MTVFVILDVACEKWYIRSMDVLLTAKLKLSPTPEQFAALRATQLAYRDGLNATSRYAFEHGKTSNQRALQRGMYSLLRTKYHLPAQMACNVPRHVGATYKGLWTKAKQNAQLRQAGLTKKRYKGLDQPPTFVSPTLTYNFGRDYTLKAGQQVSLLTLHGRVVVPYTGYDKHVAVLRQGAQLGAARLHYDKPKKRFYLLVTLQVQRAEPTPEQQPQVVGVDVGVRYLAVSSTAQGKAAFYSGAHVVAKANHYARLRKRLQQKGTRAATRRLVALSGRERRLKADANHVVSQRIVTSNPHCVLGLEHLTGIRERTPRKRGKKASRKQRKANAVHSKWSFAQLQSMLAYKAQLGNSVAIRVDAHYSSQTCPRCGHCSEKNRPNKGLLFVCQNCQYSLHADLVGARNLTLRTRLIRQDWVRAGQLSVVPDVSDQEAKAARLRRYAELRWSRDTSPSPSGDVGS